MRKQPAFDMMKDRNLTVPALSYITGVEPVVLRNMLNGLTYPTEIVELRLAEYFGTTVDELFSNEVIAANRNVSLDDVARRRVRLAVKQ